MQAVLDDDLASIMQSQFPSTTETQVRVALNQSGGHAGKAANILATTSVDTVCTVDADRASVLRLQRRFPTAKQGEIQVALVETGNHAGKAANILSVNHIDTNTDDELDLGAVISLTDRSRSHLHRKARLH